MKEFFLVLVLVAFFAVSVHGWCRGCYQNPFGRPGRMSCKHGQKGYNRNSDWCRCSGRRLASCYRIRREFSTMNAFEKLRYIGAYKKASTLKPYKYYYNHLIDTHTKRFNSGIHRMSQFLPWHREFLLNMENLLRRVDPRVTIPYWDWSVEANYPWKSGPHDVFGHSPWSFGGNGTGKDYCVTTGPFAKGKWRTTYSSRNRGCPIKRRFNGSAPDVVAIQKVLNNAKFKDFEVLLRVELHNSMHCRIGNRGGTMCSRASANAPEFFLHHAFVDFMWHMWQIKGRTKGDRYRRDKYFKYKPRMVASRYYPRQLLDNSYLPGGVRVMYEMPKKNLKLHKELEELPNESLDNIPRLGFTRVGNLEFNTFHVGYAERKKVLQEQKSLEPRRRLKPSALKSTKDKGLGMKVDDIDKEVRKKRSMDLKKKQARDHLVNV